MGVSKKGILVILSSPSGAINPYPFFGLNHFTVPVVIYSPFLSNKYLVYPNVVLKFNEIFLNGIQIISLNIDKSFKAI